MTTTGLEKPDKTSSGVRIPATIRITNPHNATRSARMPPLINSRMDILRTNRVISMVPYSLLYGLRNSLRLFHYSEKIATPDFFDFFLTITALDQLIGDITSLTDIIHSHYTSSPVQVRANSNMIHAHQFDDMINMIYHQLKGGRFFRKFTVDFLHFFGSFCPLFIRQIPHIRIFLPKGGHRLYPGCRLAFEIGT